MATAHEDIEASLKSGEIVRRNSCKSSTNVGDALNRQNSGASPGFIILCLWPGATHDQVSQYTDNYAMLYPTSRLLLLPISIWPLCHGGRQTLSRVLDALTSDGGEKAHRQSTTVLLHLFGQSGAAQACNLLHLYRTRTGKVLPVKTVVSDVEPTFVLARYGASIERHQPFVLLNALISVIWYTILTALMNWSLQSEAQQHTRAALSDPELLPAEARRCYVLAHNDAMSFWADNPCSNHRGDQHNEQHVKRKDVDGQSRWSKDQQSYWSTIESAWLGS